MGDYPDSSFLTTAEQDRAIPAKSEAQRRLMGAELSRLRAGKKTRTGMSETQLRHYARKPKRASKR